jgi:bifunctional DNase/RNase
MEILGLSTSPSSGGAYALILSETEGTKRLPIIIGTFEAQAIALELEHIKPPRPMTHDLVRNIIQSFNSFVKHIFINELREGTFYAQIVYDSDGEQIEQDARPSDAIAVAIRFNAPIYVAKSIIDEAGIESEPDADTETAAADSAEEAEDPIESAVNVPGREGESRLRDLEKNLKIAISEENYEKAAKIRDELKKLKG